MSELRTIRVKDGGFVSLERGPDEKDWTRLGGRHGRPDRGARRHPDVGRGRSRSVFSCYGWRAVRSRTGRPGPWHSPGRIRAAATVRATGCGWAVNLRDHGTGGYGAVARATNPATPFGPGHLHGGGRARDWWGETRGRGSVNGPRAARRNEHQPVPPCHHPLEALRQVGSVAAGGLERARRGQALTERRLVGRASRSALAVLYHQPAGAGRVRSQVPSPDPDPRPRRDQCLSSTALRSLPVPSVNGPVLRLDPHGQQRAGDGDRRQRPLSTARLEAR